MRGIAALVLSLAAALLCRGPLAAEELHPRPVLPGSPSRLIALLSSPRSDLRHAAFLKLMSLKGLPLDELDAAVEEAPACARVFLYDLAGAFGDERTLKTLVSLYDAERPRDFESVRLMENILLLGAEYPLPPSFLPHVLSAWLEGDEAMSEAAEAALLRAGKEAVPELIWQYYSADEGRKYSALKMLVRLGELPPPLAALREFPRGPNGSAALDALMAVTGSAGPALAALERGGDPEMEGAALWWLAALFPEKVTPEMLDEFAARGKDERERLRRAYHARLLMRALRPEEWRRREEELRDGRRALTLEEALLMVYCADRESQETLMLARCGPEAATVRARWLASGFGGGKPPAVMGAWYELMMQKERSAPAAAAAAGRLAARARPLVEAGRRAEAARVLSRSLTLAWDPEAATELMALLAEDPALPASLYLEPFGKWRAAGRGALREADFRFARALLGSAADARAARGFLEREGGKVLLERRYRY